MNKYLVFTLLILTGLSSSINAAETVYISSQKAKIFREANFDSDLIAKLEQYEAVEVLGRKGIWIQIKNSDITGWVSRYSVTSVKMFKKKISIFNRIKNFFRTQTKRDRMAIVSTVGGIRGLADGDDESTGKKDFESVKVMETMKLSNDEIDEFIAGNTD